MHRALAESEDLARADLREAYERGRPEYVPAVVLMDLRLPDIDGAEAARILKDEPRTAAIPILAVTAIALDDEREWLARAGQ